MTGKKTENAGTQLLFAGNLLILVKTTVHLPLNQTKNVMTAGESEMMTSMPPQTHAQTLVQNITKLKKIIQWMNA